MMARCGMHLKVLLLAAAIVSSAARALSNGGSSLTRGLQQMPRCPEGCTPSGCVQDATAGGLRCVSCQGSLAVRNNGDCGCVAGHFYSGPNTCSTCRKGSYCPGGPLTPDSQPQQMDCPEGMTTAGARSIAVLQCVNLPGYFYAPSNSSGSAPSASLCPADTWSTGLRKQRQCVPCPPGFTTGGVTGASSATACFVPAGFFLLPSNGGAAPCPYGTYRSAVGGIASCTTCAVGVTTAAEGSASEANCTVLVPGVYAVAMNGTAITATKRCPQRYYCPGGVPQASLDPAALSSLDAAEPSIMACPDGTYTQGLAAASADECFTPPGFFTSNGTTSQCPPASFRAEWLPSDEATSCNICGEGVFGTPTDGLSVFDPITEAESVVQVMTSSSGCYIKPGQGLYRMDVGGKRTYRIRNCDDNSYGVSRIAYGRTPYPCRDCPAGMVASKDNTTYPNSASFCVDNGDGTGGFVGVKACVTQAGYGYSSRQAQPCAQGYYNNRDTWSTCTACPYGTTTAGPGLGVTAADCKLAPGFGAYNGTVLPCPVGTYSDSLRNDTNGSCSACPPGTTTQRDGADSVNDCVACQPGYGGPGCATQCGGVGDAASYGPPDRPVGASCVACSTAITGYSFEWMGELDTFAPRTVAKLGADSPSDCLSEFVQVHDTAWYLPFTGDDMVAVAGVSTVAACSALCNTDCMFFTYDYRQNTCHLKKYNATSVHEGAPLIAFKTENAGDAAASSLRNQHVRSTKGMAQTKALSSGYYVFYQDATAPNVGVQTLAPNAARFNSLRDCLTACDLDNACAAATVDVSVDMVALPKTCRLIKGDATQGIVYKRSMIRADINRLQSPVSLLP